MEPLYFKMIKIYFGLFIILPVIANFWACSSSVQQGLVIWSEGDQILLDVGSDDGIGVGDKASIHREIQLTHPASGEDLGTLKEKIADASIIAVRKDTATAKLVEDNLNSVHPTIQPGDKVVITEQKGVQTTNFSATIGSVIFVDSKSQSIDINFLKSSNLYPNEILTVGMPSRILGLSAKRIDRASGDKIALLMKKIADVEVIAVDSISNTASCRITKSSGLPEIGDTVVKLSEPSISAWFQETDESSEEMILKRAYRQALRYYESAEYWQVIRKLQTILGLSAKRIEIEASKGDFEDTLYLLAASYKHVGMYDRAQKYFQRAARQKPEDAKIWLELAYMYLEQNRLKEAVNAYQQLTKLLPNNYQLWIDLSNIYSRMGDQAKSNAAYQKAIQLETNDE
ncbi:MAG: tetratricopeptide repeat protein [Candidatus Poribacteria bacterium]